jgi:hypothetical protein
MMPKDMMPKKSALKSLIKAMKGLQMKKIQGYKETDDDIPAMVAKAEPKKKKKPEDMED